MFLLLEKILPLPARAALFRCRFFAGCYGKFEGFELIEKTKETMRLLGHDFEHDRPALDFYETPPQAVIGLLQKESFEGTCWDPASGNGAITKFFPNMFASDIRTDDQVIGEKGVDFLKQDRYVQNIIVNPPFSLSLEFAIHALKYSEKLALFQKIQFLESVKRYKLFKVNPPNRIHVFVDRLSCPDGIHTSGKGGMMCFAWYVWEKGSSGTSLDWISS